MLIVCDVYKYRYVYVYVSYYNALYTLYITHYIHYTHYTTLYTHTLYTLCTYYTHTIYTLYTHYTILYIVDDKIQSTIEQCAVGKNKLDIKQEIVNKLQRELDELSKLDKYQIQIYYTQCKLHWLEFYNVYSMCIVCT